MDYSHGLQVDGVLGGNIAVDGSAGTVLTNLGKVLEDTIEVNPVAVTTQNFKAQGESSPFLSVSTRGFREGRFEVATMDKEMIADWTGGSVTGVGAAMVYHDPIGDPNIEKTLKFIDSEGVAWLYPRCKINADLDGKFRNGVLNKLVIAFTVMQPTKAGVSSFSYGNPAP